MQLLSPLLFVLSSLLATCFGRFGRFYEAFTSLPSSISRCLVQHYEYIRCCRLGLGAGSMHACNVPCVRFCVCASVRAFPLCTTVAPLPEPASSFIAFFIFFHLHVFLTSLLKRSIRTCFAIASDHWHSFTPSPDRPHTLSSINMYHPLHPLCMQNLKETA